MKDTWNIVQKGDTKIVWKDFDETNVNEIKEIEQELKSEPYFCKTTNSIVFKTDSKELRIMKGPNYSELELISRYLTTESKLYDLLES
mgnify:FL=1|tara:strand:- start:100 stop:363 length:264 start_codon:yes stop_codon:yes gene_type:complete